MDASSIRIEDQLVEGISDLCYEDLDADTVNYCKQLLMDTLGVTFPGSRAPGCTELVDLVRNWATPEGAPVLLHGFRAAPPQAALVNSTMMHALDFDDTLDASALHAMVTALPAALSAAATRGRISGRDLISALVLGVDVTARISLGIQQPLSWIRTATCGTFGAAAAAARTLGLKGERLADAFGIAYSQTAGNAQGLIEGRLVKRMQPGFAASAGVTAALLAQQGITGSRGFLTGRYGYYRLYENDAFDPHPVVAALGRHFHIKDLSIKPYPCCRMTHSSIDAALDLRHALTDATPIKQVAVAASEMVTTMVGKPFQRGDNPQVDAQFSIPYTVACALLQGDVFLQDFTEEATDRPAILALADKVTVTADNRLPAKDLFRATVTLHIADHAPRSRQITLPRGNPGNPLDTDQCREKFTKCLAYSRLPVFEARRDDLLECIQQLETLADIGRLLALMQP